MRVSDAEVFLVVAEELHFGRAAARLFMTQPPVTRIIRRLEEELGAQLFLRTTRQVSLTPQGEAFIEPARRLVDTQMQARQIVKAAAFSVSGTVKSAFTGVSAQSVIARLVGRLRRDQPGISLELHNQLFSQALMQHILNEDIDIGFGRWDVTPDGIRTQTLKEETLLLALPSSHRLADTESIWMSELMDEPFIAYPRSSGAVVNHRLDMLADAAGFSPKIVQIAPDAQTALTMVAESAGIVLTLSTVAESCSNPKVMFVPVRDKCLPTYLRVAWRESSEDLPAFREILAILAQEFPLARPDSY